MKLAIFQMNVVALYLLFCSMTAVSVANAAGGVGRLRRRTIRGQESSSTTRQQQQGRELQLDDKGEPSLPEEKTEKEETETTLPATAKNIQLPTFGGRPKNGNTLLEMAEPIEENVEKKKKKAKKVVAKKLTKAPKEVKENESESELGGPGPGPPKGAAAAAAAPMKEATEKEDEAPGGDKDKDKGKDKEDADKGGKDASEGNTLPADKNDKNDAVEEDEEEDISPADEDPESAAGAGPQPLGTPQDEVVDDIEETPDVDTDETPDVFDLSIIQPDASKPQPAEENAAPAPKPKPDTPKVVDVGDTTTTNEKEVVEKKNP